MTKKRKSRQPTRLRRQAERVDDALRNTSLMDERGRTIAWVIRDIDRLYAAVGQKTLRPLGVTMAHWYYLRVLESGPLSQLDLSKRVGMASTTTVPVVDFLASNDLVTRTTHPKDRRKNNVALTEKGQKLIDEVMRVFAKVLRDSIKGLSKDEMNLLMKTLLVLESNLMTAVEGEVPPINGAGQ